MTDLEKRVCLREILSASRGVIAPGIADPMFAKLAEDCGYPVIHLSGNAIHKSFCLPDDNLITFTEIESRAARIADATDIPLIVDLGSGNREVMQIGRAVRLLERAGVAAIRIEDSYQEYHGAGKPLKTMILPTTVMAGKIKAAADSRSDSSVVLVARCDSRSIESLEAVEERLARYAEAGADALGVQLSQPAEFFQIARACSKPLVSLWPRKLMSVFEFLQSGFRVALLPSAISLAAVSAARQMLIELSRSGTERDYFDRVIEREEAERWYRQLGDKPGRLRRH